jgi:hypothetical protein
MASQNIDEVRNAELRARRDNGYGKTPSDLQQQLDWAHQCRVINEEIVVSKKGTK